MAAANVTVLGRTARVRGRVTGAGDLEVHGFVEGEIVVGGDVTVDAQGLVGANVRGRRLVVRGAVKGDLVGEESVLLEDGARVVGDVRAPRVAIAPGALVRGYVETGEGGVPSARAARTVAAARPATFAQPKAAPVAAKAVPPPLPKVTGKSSSGSATQEAGATGLHAARATNNSGPRRPPPPVVPAMKKVKGQIAKKKER